VTALKLSAIFQCNDRQSAVDRYERLFGSHPTDEFQIHGRDLMVTVFAGFSVLSGTPEALAPVRDLRATVFVDSLEEIEERLVKTGWKIQGALGSRGNVLARDPDGNMLEFVEVPSDGPRRPTDSPGWKRADP
jgi:hypothetical protein